MPDSVSKNVGKVIQIDEDQIRKHLGELVRGSVEETLNKLLDAEADKLCNAARYERTAARLRHVAGTRWGTRRYLNMDLLTELKKEEEIAA